MERQVTTRPVVVVGASVAGVRVVQALRAGGHQDGIVLVDAETTAPYDKPALSKDVLTGVMPAPQTLVTPARLAELDVDYRPGCAAIGLDLAARVVDLSDSDPISFAQLVVATGSQPRRLAGLDGVEGVQYLRTRADALALHAAFSAGPRVVVVGGGFIGGEVASSARALGLDVTIIEAAPRMLSRLMPTAVSQALHELHEDHGVTVQYGQSVRSWHGNGRLEALELDDGQIVPADVVVVGVGTAPTTGWLAGSGLDLTDGISCGTDLSANGTYGVYVAGDAARWPEDSGRLVRTEHWTGAREQASVVAHNLLHPASPRSYRSAGYVWSDQHGVKIQHVGRSGTDLPARVVPTSDGTGQLFQHLLDGRVVGATAFDAPRDLLTVRRLLTPA